MSKKKKDKCKFLNMGPIPISVGFCKNEKAYKIELKKLECEYDGVYVSKDACVNFVANGSEVVAFVCINETKAKDNASRAQIDSLLAHEAIHVLQECRLVMGEKQMSSEVEAYTLQHILQFLIMEFWGEDA